MHTTSYTENRRLIRTTGITAGLLTVLLFLSGCQTSAQSGAAIGAGIGVLAGQAIGGNTEDTLIGGVIGAGTGYVIGNEIDKQEQAKSKPHSSADEYESSSY
ncbi:MAG: glycine zipper domain-containing protein [Planctomycetota bacterium]